MQGSKLQEAEELSQLSLFKLILAGTVILCDHKKEQKNTTHTLSAFFLYCMVTNCNNVIMQVEYTTILLYDLQPQLGYSLVEGSTACDMTSL